MSIYRQISGQWGIISRLVKQNTEYSSKSSFPAMRHCFAQVPRPDDVIDFLRRLWKKLRHPLIVVWDRWSVHRSAERRITEKGWKGIEFEYLPAYCPELNPVEAMWSHAKYADLANYVPDQLHTAVDASNAEQARLHRLKLSFLKTAQLRL